MDRLLEKAALEKKKYLEKFIQKQLELVPENTFDGYTEGYSENYIRVYVKGELPKRPTQVCVDGLFKDGVLAHCM